MGKRTNRIANEIALTRLYLLACELDGVDESEFIDESPNPCSVGFPFSTLDIDELERLEQAVESKPTYVQSDVGRTVLHGRRSVPKRTLERIEESGHLDRLIEYVTASMADGHTARITVDNPYTRLLIYKVVAPKCQLRAQSLANGAVRLTRLST